MIAGGDENRRVNGTEGLYKAFGGFHIGAVGIHQIPRQQHQIHLPVIGKGGDPVQQEPLLFSPEHGLVLLQSLKRGIQMQISRVKEPQLFHSILIPSALRHFPLSGSTSNRQPSILPAPLPGA